MKKLVLASSNPGKLREFEMLLAPLGMEIVPQASLGVSDAEEPHGTFVEIQGTAEGEPFSTEQMGALVALAKQGIAELIAKQKAALGVS